MQGILLSSWVRMSAMATTLLNGHDGDSQACLMTVHHMLLHLRRGAQRQLAAEQAFGDVQHAEFLLCELPRLDRVHATEQ